MRSRRSSFPRPTGARCASRPRPGARSNCRFCSTGKQGFSRNLDAARDRRPGVARQPLRWRCAGDCSRCRPRDDGSGRRSDRVSNVVFMGMGEPLHNYDADAGGTAHPARRPCLRPVAAAGHGVDLGRGADDRPACARTARWRWRSRCTRPTMRCATAGAAESQVSAARADGRVPALPRARAARFHHLRVRDARRRQRQRRARRANCSRWCATCRASST